METWRIQVAAPADRDLASLVTVAVDCTLALREESTGGWLIDAAHLPVTPLLRGQSCDRASTDNVRRVSVIEGCPTLQQGAPSGLGPNGAVLDGRTFPAYAASCSFGGRGIATLQPRVPSPRRIP